MKPDAICTFASMSAGDELNAARTLGFEGPFFNTSPLGAEIMAQQISPEYANNAFCNGFNPFDPNELMQEVMDRWKAKYPDEQWVSDAFMGWDSGWALIQAMEKAQSVDPYEIVTKGFDTMTNPGDLQTLLGDSRMGGMYRFGVNRALVRPIPMTRFVNGECVSEAYILPAMGQE